MLVYCKNKPAVVFSARSQARFIIYYLLFSDKDFFCVLYSHALLKSKGDLNEKGYV